MEVELVMDFSSRGWVVTKKRDLPFVPLVGMRMAFTIGCVFLCLPVKSLIWRDNPGLISVYLDLGAHEGTIFENLENFKADPSCRVREA